jgi:hypothetical protein
LPEFLTIARTYCSFIESTDTGSSNEFLSSAQEILLDLYQMGKKLPEVDVIDKDFQDLLSDADYKTALKNIGRRCPFQYYWNVLDPFNFEDPNTEIGVGDITDDLGDIYRDIKSSLLLYDSGLEDAQLAANWQLKFDFDSHWSTHCIDGLKAIHDYLLKD